MDNIGARLKTIRTHQGWSQRQLALKSGVSNATISLIEHGKTDPSMGLLKRILETMGISFAEFFSSDSRPSDKYFYSGAELSDLSSGPISYRQVGSDLRDNQLQLLHERYAPGADTDVQCRGRWRVRRATSLRDANAPIVRALIRLLGKQYDIS